MPKKESVQQKLKRIRPPRVQITYDVEIGGAIEMKELPFVVGVLGDFSGQPVQQLPRIKDRKLIEIDRDNFDQVLAAQAPRLALRVDNKLTDDGSKMNVEMKFNNMLDFEPDMAELRPDFFVVNTDGGSAEKRRLCERYGVQYVELERTPRPGLPPRSSTKNLTRAPG